MTSPTPPVDDWIAYTGAHMVAPKASLPKIWIRLHDNAVQWTIMRNNRALRKNLDAVDGIDLDLMSMLSNASAAQWIDLCKGAGATVPGAIGLSWCADAKVEDVWAMWFESGVSLRPDPVARRFARMLNPALVQDTVSVSEIAAQAQRDVFPACIAVLRMNGTLNWDLPADRIASIPPVLAEFLLHEIGSIADRPQGMQAFVDHWSSRVPARKPQSV